MATARRLLRPLVAPETYRCWLYLFFGGALSTVPMILAALLVESFTDGGTWAPLPLLGPLVAAALGYTGPGRRIELTLVRLLTPGEDLDRHRGDRRMGMLLVLVHVGAALLAWWLLRATFELHTTMLGLGVAALVALLYAVYWLGELVRVLARAAFAPSRAERLAAAERDLRRSAARDRLSADVHDSVGHALTLHAMQAGAAQQLLDTDPEFARSMLADIQRTSRQAAEDLDRVLGMLRSGRHDAPGDRSLAELDALLESTRAAGTELTVHRDDDLHRVPAAVSGQAYRIIQEGLTNVVRHGAGSAELTLRLTGGELCVQLVNPVRPDRPEPGASRRGVHGMSRRVAELGGRFRTGEDDGQWRLTARLPVPDA